MANRHRQQMRSTTTERQCPVCKGAGETYHNESGCNDPQCEYELECLHCNGGWIRFAPVDPLIEMSRLRARRLSPRWGIRYGELQARALTDVPLPRDFARVEWRAAA